MKAMKMIMADGKEEVEPKELTTQKAIKTNFTESAKVTRSGDSRETTRRHFFPRGTAGVESNDNLEHHV